MLSIKSLILNFTFRWMRRCHSYEESCWQVPPRQAFHKALNLIRQSARGYRQAEGHVRKMLNRAIFERIEVLTKGDAEEMELSAQLTGVYLRLTETATALTDARASKNPDPSFFGPGFALQQTGGVLRSADCLAHRSPSARLQAVTRT